MKFLLARYSLYFQYAFCTILLLMKKIFVFLLACACGTKSLGQLEFKNSNVGRTMGFADQNGNSLLKKYDPDVTGSPFLNSDWTLARITLSSGKMVGVLPVRLNIESNELYFRDSSGTELIAIPTMVRKVECVSYYTKDSIRYIFKNGYPKVDQQNENYYYQVLAQGKVELVRKAYKYIRTTKNDLSGEVAKIFLEDSKLYLYANGALHSFQPAKDFVLSQLEDKKPLMVAYLEANKINFKKIPDLIKLFGYYNGLE